MRILIFYALTLLSPCLVESAFWRNLKGRIPPARGGKIELLPLDGGLAASSVEQPGVGGIRSDNLSTFFGFRSFLKNGIAWGQYSYFDLKIHASIVAIAFCGLHNHKYTKFQPCNNCVFRLLMIKSGSTENLLGVVTKYIIWDLEDWVK